MPKMAGTWLGQSQELRNQSGYFIWLADTQVLEPSLLPPKVYISMKMEPECWVLNTGTPMWGAGCDIIF